MSFFRRYVNGGGRLLVFAADENAADLVALIHVWCMSVRASSQ